MADNVTLDAGSGGDTVAADDIGGIKFPRSKIVIGADGTNDGDVSSANPLPVTHAALTELATAIDTELQVDVVGALPAGTNAIGKLAANSGVDIGDVDVTSFPTTVHSADYDSGAGTDTTLAFGIAVPASGGAAVIPGDATAGLKVDLGADNDVTVTGSVTANAGTNLNTSLLALESGGNLATLTTSAGVMDDWDESDRAKVNLIVGQAGIAAGAGAVGVTVPRITLASDDPGVALLTTIDVDTGNIATSVGVMDDWDNAASDGASVSGDVAHDSPDAGEPVKVGAKALAHGSSPTAVAANDRTDLYANRHGILWTIAGHPNIVTKEFTFTDSDGAQTDAALVTVSAGTKIAVTNVAAVCDNANTGDVAVRVGFAAATLTAVSTSGIAGIVMSHPGIASGSGYNRGDGSAVLGVGADGEDLRITCEDPAGGSIRVLVSYFEIAS